MRGRSTPERIVPTGPKVTNIEIAQARDLDVEFFVVRQGRTNFTRGMSVRRLGASIAARLPCYRLRP